jgi:lipopolysaccharide transport system permease protein
VRDISAQYPQSVLGMLWALINPLTTTAVWLFGTGTLLAKINFPREALIHTGTYKTLFIAASKIGILLLVMPPSPPGVDLWRHRPGHIADHSVSDAQ